jgi:hypothetical protein
VTDQIANVYNMRVADYHTYFVGGAEWGFDVWAHNTNCSLASVKDHLEGDTHTLDLNVIGRKGKIQLGKESDRLVAGRHPDTEIVYVVRDRVSGEIVTSGKTSVGEGGVNLRQRVMHYTRDGDFVNSHPNANVPRVQLEMQLGFVRTQSVKAFQQAGHQVETGVEAPLRANLQKEWGLLWDNTNGRLGIPGQKELRNNLQIFENWVDTRDAWLWQGSGI